MLEFLVFVLRDLLVSKGVNNTASEPEKNGIPSTSQLQAAYHKVRCK